jgi:hypothetical protein
VQDLDANLFHYHFSFSMSQNVPPFQADFFDRAIAREKICYVDFRFMIVVRW